MSSEREIRNKALAEAAQTADRLAGEFREAEKFDWPEEWSSREVMYAVDTVAESIRDLVDLVPMKPAKDALRSPESGDVAWVLDLDFEEPDGPELAQYSGGGWYFFGTEVWNEHHEVRVLAYVEIPPAPEVGEAGD